MLLFMCYVINIGTTNTLTHCIGFTVWRVRAHQSNERLAHAQFAFGGDGLEIRRAAASVLE